MQYHRGSYSKAKNQVFQISLKIAPLDRSFRDDCKNVEDHMFYLSCSMLKFGIKKLIKYSSFSLYNYCFNYGVNGTTKLTKKPQKLQK